MQACIYQKTIETLNSAPQNLYLQKLDEKGNLKTVCCLEWLIRQIAHLFNCYTNEDAARSLKDKVVKQLTPHLNQLGCSQQSLNETQDPFSLIALKIMHLTIRSSVPGNSSIPTAIKPTASPTAPVTPAPSVPLADPVVTTPPTPPTDPVVTTPPSEPVAEPIMSPPVVTSKALVRINPVTKIPRDPHSHMLSFLDSASREHYLTALGRAGKDERFRTFQEACSIIVLFGCFPEGIAFKKSLIDETTVPISKNVDDEWSLEKRQKVYKNAVLGGKHDQLSSNDQADIMRLSHRFRELLDAGSCNTVTNISYPELFSENGVVESATLKTLPGKFSEWFPNLKLLTLHGKNVSRLPKLNFSRLKELTFYGLGTSNLPNLVGCPALIKLTVQNGMITSIDTSQLPPSLNSVTLTNNKNLVEIRGGWTKFKALTHLDISQSALSDLTIQSNTLTSLNLRLNRFTAFPNLQTPNLSSLDLAHNPITKLRNQDLANCSNLTMLTLSNTALEEIEETEHLTQLTYLEANNAKFSRFPQVISKMTALTRVDFSIDKPADDVAMELTEEMIMNLPMNLQYMLLAKKTVLPQTELLIQRAAIRSLQDLAGVRFIVQVRPVGIQLTTKDEENTEYFLKDIPEFPPAAP